MRVVVLGASGFVGRALTAALRARGDDVEERSLRDPAAAAGACEGFDAIVNLAGEPIAQRWTPSVKVAIEESRTERPKAFIAALAHLTNRPHVYVSASAVGYYGTSESQTFTEVDHAGSDFLGRVCARWEKTALKAAELGMRVAIVRTGLALSTTGGALEKMLAPFKLGLGGAIGNGQQWYSWIHLDDLIGIYLLALDGADGAINAAAPEPVTNREFTRLLGVALHRPTILPTPACVLRAMFGEGADVLIFGQRVEPARALELGYRFRYPLYEDALRSFFE